MNGVLILGLVSCYTLCSAEEVIKNRDIWLDIQCDEEYQPNNCEFDRIPNLTVEDYERCAPAQVPLFVRNYYLGWSGRGLTYKRNQEDFKRIRIIPKMLRDLSDSSLEVTILGKKVAFPVGVAPSAFHILANPNGEIATVMAAAEAETVMILSSIATTAIEDVAAAVPSSTLLWMQIYIFKNRSYTIDIIRRAEKSGFNAIVLTCDSPIYAHAVCHAKEDTSISDIQLANIPGKVSDLRIAIATFADITWLRSITSLPIIAKGILRGDDAVRAVRAGASAIIVSTHGGRQLDSGISSIDALPGVVTAIRRNFPPNSVEVYLDSGIRNGYDVYKALARGAKMVFVGRPVLWGLILEGQDGVTNVLKILKTEFNNTMLLAGSRNPSEIHSSTISPAVPGI